MILYLTDSLRVKEGDSVDYVNILRRSIRFLALSAMEGRHYLYGDLSILEYCEEFMSEEDIKGFFHHLVYNWTSLSIPAMATYYLEIVRDNPQAREENGRFIGQREISSFHKMDSVAACQFICENDSDCFVYTSIGKWFMRVNNFKAPLSLYFDGSGGCHGAKERIQKHRDINQICLCILDSDKWHKNRPINPAARDCARAHDKPGIGYRCLILEVRELENLLPLNYIDIVFSATKELTDHSDRVRDKRYFDYLKNSQFSLDILPYFDYKLGIKKDDNFQRDPDLQVFAELCWSQNPEICTGQTFQEYVASIDENTNILYTPLLRRITSFVSTYMKAAKSSGSLPHPALLDFQLDEWNRLGQEIVNWGYASEEFFGAS